MKHVYRYFWVGTGVVLNCCSVKQEKMAETPHPPNIILLMADDLGYGDVAFNGNKFVKTPALDSMAASCILFNRFYAAAPVSTPTRASCLTGRHPYRMNMTWASDNALPEQENTLAEILKTAGYTTGHFGKWHLGDLTRTLKDGYGPDPVDSAQYSPPWENGFDECYTVYSSMPLYNPYYLTCEEMGKPGYRMIMDRPVELGQRTGGFMWNAKIWTGPGQFVDEWPAGVFDKLIMDKAIDFIRQKKDKNEPFLSLIWFNTPHTPVVAGNDHRALYPGQTMEQQHWFGSISAMDEQVGRLRKELSDLGIADNTILWFCSDNGPSWVHNLSSSGGLRGKKGTLYEGGIRVPAILEYPGKFKGHKVIDIPVTTSDFLPTLLGWAGVEVPGDHPIDGMDVNDIIEGKATERSKPIGFQSPVLQTSSQDAKAWLQYSGKAMVWLDNDYKLISVNEGKDWALYDLANDSAETKNKAVSNADLVNKMKEELYEWVKSCSESASGSDYRKN